MRSLENWDFIYGSRSKLKWNVKTGLLKGIIGGQGKIIKDRDRNDLL